MANLTPYDTGERLAPMIWVRGDTVGLGENTRAATNDDYGRVDFDNDEGATIASLYLGRTEHGFDMHVDQHSDDFIRVTGVTGPPRLEQAVYDLDVEYRSAQMTRLDEGLHAVAREFSEHVFFYEDGDIYAFHPGNYVFQPAAGRNGSCFAITEQYARGTDWSDEERVPFGWEWVDDSPATQPDGTTQMRIQAEGDTIPSDIDRLIARARTWAREHTARAIAEQHRPERIQARDVLDERQADLDMTEPRPTPPEADTPPMSR